MKKSNYLNYLNEYNHNLPIEIERTFKNFKRQSKNKTNKVGKTKNNFIKPQNTPYLPISKKI